MSKSSLANFLVKILVLCVLFTAWVSIRYYSSVRSWYELQERSSLQENTRNTIALLASEALEFSKKHPEIDPLLEKFDLKPKDTSLPAATPKK